MQIIENLTRPLSMGTFSPDGKYILSIIRDSYAMRWPMPQTLFDRLSSEKCGLLPLTQGEKNQFQRIIKNRSRDT
ncbi:MAG: hypothetical protein AAF694_16140 [Bacteroidota bacterium]